MALNRDQSVAAFAIVDEMIDCKAQLEALPDGPRRVALEAAIDERAATLQGYLIAAELFSAPTEPPDRVAFETDTIYRAFQHDLVLFANIAPDQPQFFGWRSESGMVGPQFDERGHAIDWMLDWLADDKN